MPNIHLKGETKNSLTELKARDGHGSYDSVVKALISEHLATDEPPTPTSIKLGELLWSDANLYHDRFNNRDSNIISVGDIGSGKTYSTKAELIRELLKHQERGKRLNVTVIDPVGGFDGVSELFEFTKMAGDEYLSTEHAFPKDRRKVQLSTVGLSDNDLTDLFDCVVDDAVETKGNHLVIVDDTEYLTAQNGFSKSLVRALRRSYGEEYGLHINLQSVEKLLQMNAHHHSEVIEVFHSEEVTAAQAEQLEMPESIREFVQGATMGANDQTQSQKAVSTGNGWVECQFTATPAEKQFLRFNS